MNKSYCRLCAKLKPSDKLTNFQSNISAMNEIFQKLARINVHVDFIEDNLPKTICILCYRALDAAFEFTKAVENAQNILKTLQTTQKEERIVFVKNEPKEATANGNVQSDYESFVNKHEYVDDAISLHDTVKTETVCNSSIKNEIDDKNKNALIIHVRKAGEATKLSCGDVNKNWQDYNWTCSYCETLFLTIDELQKHSLEIHSKCNAYRCTDCGIRRRDLNRFIQHIYKHNEHLKSSCYKCFLTLPVTSKLPGEKHRHITTEHVCIGCNMCFSSPEDLEIHKQKYYAFIRAKKLKAKNQCGSCKICNKTFKQLSVHMLTHMERTRDHTCEKCGKSFFTKEILEQHYVAHSADKPYECKICKQSFKTRRYLLCHVVIHNEVKPFSCDQCDKSYYRLRDLNHHKKVHTDTWYECNICSKRYKLKMQLTLHLKLHSGIMPYSCEACQWNFTNYTNYFKHMKGKHNTDIRKKKSNSTDANILEWKEELVRKRPRQRRRQIKDSMSTKGYSLSGTF